MLSNMTSPLSAALDKGFFSTLDGRQFELRRRFVDQHRRHFMRIVGQAQSEPGGNSCKQQDRRKRREFWHRSSIPQVPATGALAYRHTDTEVPAGQRNKPAESHGQGAEPDPRYERMIKRRTGPSLASIRIAEKNIDV